ncbi:DcrB-related protein, partial [Lonsdalea quercina]
STEGPMHQVVVMQVRGQRLLTFTVTAAGELREEQKTALLAVVESFKSAS